MARQPRPLKFAVSTALAVAPMVGCTTTGKDEPHVNMQPVEEPTANEAPHPEPEKPIVNEAPHPEPEPEPPVIVNEAPHPEPEPTENVNEGPKVEPDKAPEPKRVNTGPQKAPKAPQ